MILGLAVIVLLAQKRRSANVATAVVCAPYTAPVGAINAVVIDVLEQETAHVQQREAALRDAEARVQQQEAALRGAEARRQQRVAAALVEVKAMKARDAAAAAAAATAAAAAAATAKRQAKRGQPTRLYHVTSKAAALSIQRSGKMKKGSQGAYGGGIYFASSRESANYKAHSKGYVIEADVYLGNPLQVSSTGDHSLRELKAKGYNSVHAARGPGGGNPEWVVYSGDQVEIRSVAAY